MSSPQLQQAFFISLTNNGKQGSDFSFYLTTYGPNFPAPIGAGLFGNAIWQQSDASDIFTYSLVNNPSPQLEPLGGSPPITGQFITLENVGVAAGATLTINLLIIGSELDEVKKIVVGGLSILGGATFTAGKEESTTPL